MGNFIDRLIALSLRHSLAIIAATVVLAGAGIWAFLTLNTDAFPDLTPNQVLVMTEVPGFSPVEVEQQVTYPMEVAMLGLPRTQGVRSISKVGLSVVTVTFDDDVDLYFARAQVQQRMRDAQAQLPPGTEPMLGPPATAMGEVFEYLVESTGEAADSLALIHLTNVQEYIIKPLLRTVPGVASVNTWGGMLQQYQVMADPTTLAGYGLTLHDIETALANNNANFGAGYVEDRGERLTVRGLGRVADTSDIGGVVIATRGATPIHVRDVARVNVGPQPRSGAVTRDNRGEALSAMVSVVKGSNGRQVVNRVLQRLEEIKPLLPPGVQIRPFYNQGEVVARTTHTVFRNLTEGALLVIAILFLFLRNAPASLLTASLIPLSLLIAFLAMKAFGITANLMSLGALDFGLIVDASVVMVENFVRRMGPPPEERSSKRDLLRRAALEVGRPIVFGIAIIVAVYIPIFTLQGIEGRMFRPMAFTVCAAVLGSLLLALTYVPAVSSYVFARAHRPLQEQETGARWFGVVRTRYERMLDWALSHRRLVVGGAVALLAVALGSVPFLGTEFMPKLDEGYLLIETRRLPSISLPGGIAVSEDVERTLRKFPEVSQIVTNLGRPQEATEAMSLNQADVYVTFKPKREWRTNSLEHLIPRMDSALAEIPGLEYDFSAPMRMRLDEVVSGVRTDLGVKVFGDSLPLLQERAEEIKRIVQGIRGAEDVFVGTSSGAMQLELALDRTAIARYGLNVADVREAVEMGVGGMAATEVIDGRKRYPVVVRLQASFRATPEAVGLTLIRTPSGGTVTLSQLAQVRPVDAPEVINHEGGQRYVVVQSNVRGRDLGGFAADVQQQVRKRVSLPPGYYITYGGQFENQERAMRRLAVIVPIVFLLIAGFLYASFGTVRHALLVMLNVPFAFVGGVAALWLRGLHVNLSASVGFIALFGVAVLNGIVLVTYVNERRASGESLLDAVRHGALVRLRPVLMTALVASVGFIPMAISTSAGAEVQRPLATVVIGGLVTSTVLTLLVLPTLYSWVETMGTPRAASSVVAVCLALLLTLGSSSLCAQTQHAEPPTISDNSFLIEEAYNQDAGVVQHINAFQRSLRDQLWVYTFTQEWPIGGQRHQLSYTLPIVHVASQGGVTGIGDIALNYRYQLLDAAERVAAAPRFTLLLPTGNAKRALGSGGWGLQASLPMSIVWSSWLVTHVNAGTTVIPAATNESGDKARVLSYSAGGSVIWKTFRTIHVLCEIVWARDEVVVSPAQTRSEVSLTINPGVRWAYNFPNGLQIVPGIALPIGLGPSKGERSLFLYLSFEHAFRRNVM